MSKLPHGGPRTRNARETYVEQLSYGHGLTPYMNKKRKPFTHLNSVDAIDLAYQSTPDYLRQLTHQDGAIPTELMLARNIPRTKSASEMTPRNSVSRSTIGNPKYKAQEDYYDEIQSLKKDMKTVKEENSNLRAKIRRLEEDNSRKVKEIDALYDTNKDGDLRRTLSGSSTDRNNNSSTASVVMSLKQRVFKLESQLKHKEAAIDEMKSDPRWTRSAEYEIQNRALFSEVEREKVARLNYVHQNDYMASLDEEQKNAVRKLHRERDEFKVENESLKKRIDELAPGGHGDHLSTRALDRGNDRDLQQKLDNLQRDCGHYESELEQMKDDVKTLRRERSDFRDKFTQAKEDLEELKRERDEFRKKYARANEELENMQREADKRIRGTPTGRSSPLSRHQEDPRRDALSALVAVPRPQSPRTDNRMSRTTDIPSRRGSNSSDEFSMGRAKPRGSPSKPTDPPRSRPTSPDIWNTSGNGKRQAGSLKTSARNGRRSGWTSDDEARVTGFRRKRAATVIQREWRRHDKSRKNQLRDPAKARQENLDKWGSKIGSATKPSGQPSPRGSTIFDRPGSAMSKSRVSPVDNTKEAALKTVQASLRGHLNRNEFGKTQGSGASFQARPQSPASARKPARVDSDDDDDHLVVTPGKSVSKPSVLDKRRDDFLDPPKPTPRGSSFYDKLGSGARDSTFKPGASPPAYGQRNQSPPLGKAGGSKQDLFSDRNKVGTGSRSPGNDREGGSRMHRTPSPPNDRRRTPSPPAKGAGGSRASVQSDRNKLGSGSRVQRSDLEPTATKPRSFSPSNDHHASGRPSSDNVRLPTRKTPTNSKQSVQAIPEHDDDEDVF